MRGIWIADGAGVRTHLRHACITIHLTLGLSGVAVAQQPPPPKAREAQAEFVLVTTSGNASAQAIGAAGQVTFRPRQWVFDGQTAFVQNKSEDVVHAKTLAATGRAARVLTPRLQAFGQHSYLRDLFSGIEHRNNTEGGLSYLLLQTARQTLYADGGVGYLKERRTIGASLSTPTFGPAAHYKLKLSETSDITDDLLMSFDLSDSGTWRLQQAVALTARVAVPLSLKISNLIRYVDEPVPGFERTDRMTSAALVLTF
jgi:putative salt-induced outer membrane protein YdiY